MGGEKAVRREGGEGRRGETNDVVMEPEVPGWASEGRCPGSSISILFGHWAVRRVRL